MDNKLKEIDSKDLYNLYSDMLNRCKIELLTADGEIIEYEIFEEFDIEAVSFLHQGPLITLFNAEYISKEKNRKSGN
ncbi:hypothetical protein [Leptospira neocaledonica]|uniref:Uncharacterized protein n=1 Tax=Leptospira neocaledonica TaxID=2023192 RepID=A0A2M9ZVX0_9LEPT|nr:hypothetical protein [Leptospira neocaledonica]PJZ76218.1 hypothetical protein CH365_15470 [Leptospira neocaledonica]